MNENISSKKCFVIMGYGKKKDFIHNRIIDLDETYNHIIKPAVTKIGFTCIRCDSDRHCGIIDSKMYHYLYDSDFVIADLSTLNPNALYELGIRHGIKPYTTVLMIEKNELKDLPFDLNHCAMFSYEHKGDYLEQDEIALKVDELSKLLKEVEEKQEVDSPFFYHMGLSTQIKVSLEQEQQILSYTLPSEILKKVSLLSLIRRWNDTNENDKAIIQTILAYTESDFFDLINYSKQNDSLLCLSDCHWKFSINKDVKDIFLQLITPSLLNRYEENAKKILLDLDTKFELSKETRFMSSVYKKGTVYSGDLRKGVCESLTWLSQNSDLLDGKNKYLVSNVIYDVLACKDWHLWASLNNLLPILAEAAPHAFVDSFENQIRDNSDMIKELFNQEGDGITSTTLMSGILWSLEKISWFPNMFQRVCLCLAELEKLDKGGKFTNRPINSLKTLLLPWINSTSASADEKIETVKQLVIRYPELSWKIVFGLLPSMHSISMGVSKPIYHQEIIKDYTQNVSQIDYQKQISEYSNIVISLVKKDDHKIFDVLDNLNSINPKSYLDLFEYLKNRNFLDLSDLEKIELWEKLTELIQKHKKFANAKWAYSQNIVSEIELINEKLKPTDKRVLYRALFTLSEYDISDEVFDSEKQTDWDKVREIAEKKRTEAILEIIEEYGITCIEQFVVNDNMSTNVSIILAKQEKKEFDDYLVPNFLNSDNKFMENLCKNYIRISTYTRFKEFLENIHINDLSKDEQLAILLASKFEQDIWNLADILLEKESYLYWEKVNQNVYASESDLSPAILRFNNINRTNISLKCIYISIFNKKEISSDLILETFEKNILSDNEMPDYYEVVEIIKYLEKTDNINEDTLWKIEWAYYGLFKYDETQVPKTLYKVISENPKLYVEFIKYGFCEENCHIKPVLNEKETNLAENSWSLLRNFNYVPGTNTDNTINGDKLKTWINEVLLLAESSKRKKIAMNYIGKLLYHSGPDKDGLWIDKTVASILDDFSNKKMRDGFHSECINSRGCYTIDTTGETEKSIAENWLNKAAELRKNNYIYFAETIESLANFYFDSAKQSQAYANPENEDL